MTVNSPHGLHARRAELAAFLRVARARLTPADVGLPGGSASGRRRVPGLRREEVAELSGVGVTWYTWLEQGRGISASAQVVDALARALLLTADQHAHLRGLAGLPPPGPPPPGGDPLPRLQRLVDAMAPNLAAVHDRYFDYVVWNEPLARVREDPAMLPPGRRNIIWMMFTDPANRARMVAWERGSAEAATAKGHRSPLFTGNTVGPGARRPRPPSAAGTGFPLPAGGTARPTWCLTCW